MDTDRFACARSLARSRARRTALRKMALDLVICVMAQNGNRSPHKIHDQGQARELGLLPVLCAYLRHASPSNKCIAISMILSRLLHTGCSGIDAIIFIMPIVSTLHRNSWLSGGHFTFCILCLYFLHLSGEFRVSKKSSSF